MKSVVCILLIVLVLVTGVNSGRDLFCAPVSTNLHSCSDVISLGYLVGAPSPKCCDGLRLIKRAEAVLGVPRTCHCVRDCVAVHMTGKAAFLSGSKAAPVVPSSPAPDFGGDLFLKLQSMCNVTLGFGLDVNIPC